MEISELEQVVGRLYLMILDQQNRIEAQQKELAAMKAAKAEPSPPLSLVPPA